MNRHDLSIFTHYKLFSYQSGKSAAYASSRAHTAPGSERPAASQGIRAPRWAVRLVTATAPLALPTLSCVLAILAFVWLDHPLALVIAAALTLGGVVGLIRRVPFAGLWTMGVVFAGVLLRLS